jgi:hypothetical protein
VLEAYQNKLPAGNDPQVRKEPPMNISHLSTNILTQTAITALKNAYEQSSDKAAKESIVTAFKAIIQLNHDLGKFNDHDESPESDYDFDPGEYCAAV